MTQRSYLKLGNYTALATLLGGSAIFLTYYFTGDDMCAFYGLFFAEFAFVVNIIVLIIFSKSKTARSNKDALTKTIGLMLMSIPLALFCFSAGLQLLNTERIHMINKTGAAITNIKITGCEDILIDKIEAGESKNVWVNINGDCSIHMEYQCNGTRRHETVEGYTTQLDGKKFSYNIGGVNDNEYLR